MTESEKMNELMNRISFALKDDTLAQGFEIICNSFAKLKKENDCYKALESHYEEIEEDAKAIAKENEELKVQKQDLCESLDIMNNRERELLEQIEKMKCCGNCIRIKDCEKRIGICEDWK